jgi:uroporphyrinogen-III synthase
MLRVAITRAQPEADRTAERVRARGAEAIVAPLLTIVPCGYDTSTERRAGDHLYEHDWRARVPGRARRARAAWCWRLATRRQMRRARLASSMCAPPTATRMRWSIWPKRELDPAKGKVVHISGDHVGGDVSGKLRAAGFSVDWRLAYASIAAMILPDASARAFGCRALPQRRGRRRRICSPWRAERRASSLRAV